MDLFAVVAGVVGAVVSFSLVYYLIRRFFFRVMHREQVYILELVALLFSVSLFFAIVSPQAQLHHLFYLVFAIFIVSVGIMLLGTWRILSEYLTGLFITRVLDLHVGDYLEFGNMRGYVTALEDAFIVIRDPRREYVYIPYTSLLRIPFRRVKAPEGHEVRIRLFVPHGQDLRRVKELVGQVAKDYGLERLSVDVEKIGMRGVVVVVRGVLKDPRQEDELRYALLDRVYAEISRDQRPTL